MTRTQFIHRHRPDPFTIALNILSILVLIGTVAFLAHTYDDIAAMFTNPAQQ